MRNRSALTASDTARSFVNALALGNLLKLISRDGGTRTKSSLVHTTNNRELSMSYERRYGILQYFLLYVEDVKIISCKKALE